jgi:hypothetical protein
MNAKLFDGFDRQPIGNTGFVSKVYEALPSFGGENQPRFTFWYHDGAEQWSRSLTKARDGNESVSTTVP